MQFENVLLPFSVIAELYKHTLVVLDDDHLASPNSAKTFEPVLEKEAFPTPPPIIVMEKDHAPKPLVPTHADVPAHEVNTSQLHVPTTQPIKFLGGFQKEISIVVAEHFHPHIAEEDLEFISKLLTACKLSMNDVAIINVVNNPQSNQLWNLMPSKVMLMFDVDPGTLGLAFRRPHFDVQLWSEAQFMQAPALEKFRIGNDADLKILKSKLWVSLQKIFLGK